MIQSHQSSDTVYGVIFKRGIFLNIILIPKIKISSNVIIHIFKIEIYNYSFRRLIFVNFCQNLLFTFCLKPRNYTSNCFQAFYRCFTYACQRVDIGFSAFLNNLKSGTNDRRSKDTIFFFIENNICSIYNN